MFGGERGPALSYAAIAVSIPPDDARQIGRIQWPASLPGDPKRDFVTVSADYLDRASFNSKISSIARSTGRSRVLLFVHGYNNRFDEAVYRLAQIVQDSKAPVIPVLFSWPSKGLLGVPAYQDDYQSAQDARGALQQILSVIALNRNVKEVTVLCHSMGCWPTLEALRSNEKIRNVLFVAPDVDADTFRDEIRRIGNPKPRVAVFVSKDDVALKLAKSISNGKQRLGDLNPEQEPYRSDFERDGVMVFDVTNLQGDAHSRAFEDVGSVMGMIERRLAEGQQLADQDAALAAQ